jgi:serine/threonine-protein kinase RsbW
MGDGASIHDSWRGLGSVAVGEQRIYECLLPAMPTSVPRMRRDLDRVLAQQGVAEERRADVALVLTEAAGNVVVHAYGPRRPGPLYASAQLPGQTLIASVVDSGRGTGSPSQTPGAGFGLRLMGQLADELLIRSNEPEPGTSVQAYFECIGATGVRPSATGQDERAQMLRDYLRVLSATHESLRQDTEAVLAQASQALAYARRCRHNRDARGKASAAEPRSR